MPGSSPRLENCCSNLNCENTRFFILRPLASVSLALAWFCLVGLIVFQIVWKSRCDQMSTHEFAQMSPSRSAQMLLSLCLWNFKIQNLAKHHRATVSKFKRKNYTAVAISHQKASKVGWNPLKTWLSSGLFKFNLY